MHRRSSCVRAAGLLAAAALLVALAPALAAAQTVKIPRTIGFAPGANVRTPIVQECELQTVIPAAIAQSAADAELVDGAGNLELTISDVHGPGGWIFSGPKWVEVRGKLRRGGKAWTFRAKRVSMSPFAGGTCGILAKCGRNIGGDIAAWLEAPVDGAEIGDAQ